MATSSLHYRGSGSSKGTAESTSGSRQEETTPLTRRRPRSPGSSSSSTSNPIFMIICIIAGSIAFFFLVFHIISSMESSLDGPLPVKNCPSTLNKTKSNRAIASLVSNRDEDVLKLCRGLKSLRMLADLADEDLCIPSADVLIFHEAATTTEDLGLSEGQRQLLRTCVRGRTISFPTVRFDEYPPTFDPEEEQANYFKRSKWGYQQMIRFWITTIWEHPAIQSYETVMRLDSDSCFKRKLYQAGKHTGPRPNHWTIPGLPNITTDAVEIGMTNLAKEDLEPIYHAGDQKNDAKAVTKGFGPFVHEYVRKNNLTVRNPTLFQKIPSDPNRPNLPVPLFYNNFEVSQVAFMQRPEVRAFHHAMTEEEPFGVFRHRWGDAIERYATMAIFAYPHQIVYRAPNGYNHPCS